jgi:hypothetical protein
MNEEDNNLINITTLWPFPLHYNFMYRIEYLNLN